VAEHRWHARHALAATALWVAIVWPSNAIDGMIALSGLLLAVYLRARDEAEQ
jgi:hypothetical protein